MTSSPPHISIRDVVAVTAMTFSDDLILTFTDADGTTTVVEVTIDPNTDSTAAALVRHAVTTATGTKAVPR